MITRLYAIGLVLLGLLVIGCGVAEAQAPKPIRASSVKLLKKQAPQTYLGLPALQEALRVADGGVPVVISCDTPGVLSPLDGHTLEPENDGQVWRVDPLDGTSPIRNVIHVSTDTCWAAQTVIRKRNPDPESYFTYKNQRVDGTSGPALEVLLHEAFHVALQSADEGVVECAAAQNAWPLVRQFGLPAWEAKMVLVGAQWRHTLTDPEYRTVC